MKDIKDKVVDVLRSDTVLQGLLGGVPSDPRIYPYYEPKASTVSETKPAYMTYTMTMPEAMQAVGNPTLTLMVWVSRSHGSWTRAEAIRDRIWALFHKQIMITDPPDNRRLYTKVINESDSTQHQPNFTGKNLQIRLSHSTV